MEIPDADTTVYQNLQMHWQIPPEEVQIVIETSSKLPRKLGQGRSNNVLQAVIKDIGTLAAVKILRRGSAAAKETKLLQEIQIYEKCQSAHIVGFLGYSLCPTSGFLMRYFEYMPGGKLSDSLRANEQFQWYNRWAQIW